jgi:GT2 family glycosyltransferase
VDLSVVVVTWNTCELTEQCVASVLEHTRVDDMELIVVDNASTDDTVAVLRRRFPGIRIIESERNLGGPAGFNLAAKEARGEAVLLMQNDGYVRDDVIGRMTEYLLAHPEIGMLGCELQFPDGRHQYTARRHMSVWHSAVERFWLYKLVPRGRRERVLLDGFWPPEEAVDPDWLAAIQMVRASVYARAGGFDEQFYGGGEESEWGARVARAGFRIRYEPSLGVIFHIGSASWSQVWTPSQQVAGWHRAGLRSYTVQHGRARAAAFRLTEGLGATLRWAVYTAANARRPDEYYAHQAAHFKALRDFYLTPGRHR